MRTFDLHFVVGSVKMSLNTTVLQVGAEIEENICHVEISISIISELLFNTVIYI